MSNVIGKSHPLYVLTRMLIPIDSHAAPSPAYHSCTTQLDSTIQVSNTIDRTSCKPAASCSLACQNIGLGMSSWRLQNTPAIKQKLPIFYRNHNINHSSKIIIMAAVPRDKNQETFSILLNRLTTSNRPKTEKNVHFQAHFQASRKLLIDVSE